MEKITNKEVHAENIPETQALENGLRILARMIVRAINRDISTQRKTLDKEEGNSAVVFPQTNPEQREKRLALTPTEAAKLLGMGRRAMYEAIRTGQIPSIRFGRRIFIPLAALMRILAEAGKDSTNAEQQL